MDMNKPTRERERKRERQKVNYVMNIKPYQFITKSRSSPLDPVSAINGQWTGRCLTADSNR